MDVEGNAGDIDGGDCRFGVGITGQEDPPTALVQPPRGLEKFDAGHLRHALVDDEKGRRVTAGGELIKHLQRLAAGFGGDDLELAAVFPTEITFDRRQHELVVVDRQDCRLTHRHHFVRISPPVSGGRQ